MAESEIYETCSVFRCPSAATTTEHGNVGHWYVTIFFCDEHYRQLREGTPLGPTGIDPCHLRVEPLGREVPAADPGRHPGKD